MAVRIMCLVYLKFKLNNAMFHNANDVTMSLFIIQMHTLYVSDLLYTTFPLQSTILRIIYSALTL